MTLDQNFIDDLRNIAKQYDAEKVPFKRAALGAAIDRMADRLSEGQLRQVVKILLKS